MRLSAPVELPKKMHKGPPPKWGIEYCKLNAKDFQFFADSVTIKPKHKNKDIFEDESQLEVRHLKKKSKHTRCDTKPAPDLTPHVKKYHRSNVQSQNTVIQNSSKKVTPIRRNDAGLVDFQGNQQPISPNLGTFNNQLQHCPSVVELEVIKETIHSLESKKRKSNTENCLLERQYIEQKRKQVYDEFQKLECARNLTSSQSSQRVVIGRATSSRPYSIAERDSLCKEFLQQREKARQLSKNQATSSPRNRFQPPKHLVATRRCKETLSQCATALKKLNEMEGEVGFGLGQPQMKCKKPLPRRSIATIKQFLPLVDMFTPANSEQKASDDLITVRPNATRNDSNVVILQSSEQLCSNNAATIKHPATLQQQVYHYGQNQVTVLPSNSRSVVTSPPATGYCEDISQFVDQIIKEEPISDFDNFDSKRIKLTSQNTNRNLYYL